MSDNLRPRMRRQRWGRQTSCGASQRGSRALGMRGAGSKDNSTWRTTRQALVAVGVYAAQDLRNPDGVTRPLLRRGALRLAASVHDPLRRLGHAYLRLDPPTELELGGVATSVLGPEAEHNERRALPSRTSEMEPHDTAADAGQASSPAEPPR